MSWFTDIAGKAEDLLNKVDQTAATAFQTTTKSSYNRRNSYTEQGLDQRIGDLYSTNSGFTTPQRNIKTTTASLKTSELKSFNSPSSASPRKKSESDDEKLLKFLNSETLPPPPRKSRDVAAVINDKNSNLNVQDQSSSVENSKESAEILPTHDGNSSTEIDSNSNNYTDEQSNAKEEILNTENSDLKTPPIPETCAITDNCVIKNCNINEELLLAQKRADHAEAEMKRMTKKLDHWNSQISGNDKSVRELREREKDMIASIDAKDSQLAILKVRLQESDQELAIKKSIIEDLKTENDRIVKEHADVSSRQNKAMETLQQELHQVKTEFNKIKDTLFQTQTQHMQQIDKMEEEHKHLVESYSSLQKKWNELNEKNKDLSTQLKLSNKNVDALQQEYNDYKIKAQRILQSKEKLISSLKEGNLDAESIEKSEASSLMLNAEVEAVKQERDLLRDEVRRANELIETYRAEIQELEKISQNDLATSEERYKNLKELFNIEKDQKEELQLLNTQLKEELQLLREDLAKTKTAFQSRIQDREIEIEKLRRQLTAKSLSTVSQEELESRLHALTENLIQKQTIVEALSTEKNSLVLQLERLEQQLRETQNYCAQQHTFVGINRIETERKSKAVFLENPFDSNLTRRVKKVYGTIDSFSIRLGVFFRRYPISRVFVIIYMLLLHFWVLFVLLTYEPEIHNANYENLKTH